MGNMFFKTHHVFFLPISLSDKKLLMATRPQALRQQLSVASRARDPFEEVPKPKALHVTEIARLVAFFPWT